MKNLLSIIIPNYNGKTYLSGILQKLIKSNYALIVVDNASSDGSLELLESYTDQILLIENDENFGFSKAVNQGIKASNSKYVLLLNNDTDFNIDVFEKLIEVIDSDESIFSVASKMIQYHRPDLIDTAGDEYNIFGWAHKRGYNRSSKTRNRSKRVFSACAGAALYRKSVFEEIGYFDENFFAYMEDVDIGYRANIFGYKNIYCSDARILHIGSGTSGSGRNAFKARLSGRNNIYLAYKNMPFLQLLLNLPFLIIGFVIKKLFFSRYKLGKVYLEGVIEGIGSLEKIEKVPFKISNLKYYLWIQYKMMVNVVSFIINRFV